MRILFDYGLAPALYRDVGHYLYRPDVRKDVTMEWEDRKWRRRLVHRRGSDVFDVILVDARLRIASVIDYMRWEDGRYRMYISGDRIGRICPRITPRLEEMLARLALATARKTRLSDLVHTDFVYVGGRMIGPDQASRRADIRCIHTINAILDGLDFLKREDYYPNIKAEYGGVLGLEAAGEKEKRLTAEAVRDVSMMWQCGNTRRMQCHSRGVYKWDSECFLPEIRTIIPESYYRVVRRMIHLWRSGRDFDFPADTPSRFPEVFVPIDPSGWMFVDFETDLRHCIYMFGRRCGGEYACEWGSSIDDASERELMDRIYGIVSAHRSRGGVVVYYFAEDRFWRERCRHHRLPLAYHGLFAGALDLQRVFQHAPLLIRGVFDFKLKHIARALYEMERIPIRQPDGCADGAESIVLAKKYFDEGRPEHVRQILENYNRFDCDVLLELVVFLREYFAVSV